MQHFVFLEFADSRVNAFLTQLRDSFGKTQSSPVHITLRGPYREQPEPEHLLELGAKLRGHGVRIQGAGGFATSLGFAVFLRAESSVFRELWWKPDFDSNHGSFQPHLTVFESASRKDCDAVLAFLRSAQISILTYSVRLSVHTSKQASLFGTAPVEAAQDGPRVRRDLIVVGPQVLDRARALGHALASART